MAASEASVASKMTSLEKRSSFSLASIYALRMLGLFVVLPVFALEAAKYPGGNDAGLVGLAMGIYGLWRSRQARQRRERLLALRDQARAP